MSRDLALEPAGEERPISDLDLLVLARAGDYPSFEKLVGRFQGRVFGLALRIVGQRHDAEDVTQQTFLSLVEHLDSFRQESSVATWILRIATNHALKLLRKRYGLPMISLYRSADDDNFATIPHPDFIAQWSQTPDVLAQQAEIRQEIELALAKLDDKYRLVFALRDVEGLSIRETAEALELSEATVKVRLLRARLMLREALTRSFGNESNRLFSGHHRG